ncbi:hypothetical protein A3B63_01240 [Candidatus Saccharibacteria bacterium RIFCSPLOWO2_01_FULL_49_22]|nr:MAG: hypothetical protein A3B63_01240 [Candidatus Saccharibacteria bacterium RIFCSPLOWO2_01_FULL_49_22]
MKSFKLLIAGAFVFALLTPVLATRVVSAQTALQCVIDFGEFGEDSTSSGCDLGIQKLVSVNGGTFFDANAEADAVSAHIGDSVVWKVIITDLSEVDASDYYVSGTIQVFDDPFPSQVTFVSYSTSDGSTYDPTTGAWQFTLNASNQPDVTLTINSTASNVGLARNFAYLAGYACDPDFCENSGEYSDSNTENNADQAWAEISAAPVVLGESTPVVLAATGSGVAESLVAAGLIVSTFGLLGYSRFARKES